MKRLRNWDNKTWLSSKKYISNFNNFLKKKVKFKRDTKVLDIGCGRANIISSLHKNYKFRYKPVGIDIVRNENIRKNIIFRKFDGVYYLSKIKTKYDLILIKQTIHLMSQKRVNKLLNLIKKRLNSKGKLLIFILKTKNNNIPCFKKMKDKFEKSLNKDVSTLKVIKKNLKKSKDDYFKYRVKITTKKYIQMIKSRYISCLLDLTNKDIEKGIREIKLKYKNKINFTDTLKCISFNK
tara:strand:+ start:349 stop:1059 length:711 start_codon:yes stop_codon:yes gene_type:complete